MFPSPLERKLSSLGVSEDTLSQFDVIILPEDIESSEVPFRDTDENVNISKMFRVNGVKVGTSTDLNIKSHIIERRDVDIWAGVIWFANAVVVASLVNLLSAYLYDRAKKSKLRDTPLGIKITLCLRRSHGQTTIHFKGSIDDLLKILKGLQEDKEEKASKT